MNRNKKLKFSMRLAPNPKGQLLALLAALCINLISCGIDNKQPNTMHNKSASEILGNSNYPAISYGGYRGLSRQEQPTIEQIKEDLRMIHAIGIRFVRTYNMQFPHATNVVKAIDELQKADANFEMYVMLGTWIDCDGAWTEAPNHDQEDYKANQAEIARAVSLTQEYPHIVKVIAVGNEAMVHWAWSYFVQPKVILRWVTHLQELKKRGHLPQDLWITSSDNFASWGGGGVEYHNEDLNALIRAVDYISVHTYPFHDTHYNPSFWQYDLPENRFSQASTQVDITEIKKNLSEEAIGQLMDRALIYSKNQYAQVVNYLESIGVEKPVHIGETGWASSSDGFYGTDGSRAADELKQAMYYHATRAWTQEAKVSCFFFEAFDEPWKSAANPKDSENHFGLFTAAGQAKYILWPLVDQGLFTGLSRDGQPIVKTYQGDEDKLAQDIFVKGFDEFFESLTNK